MRIRLRHRGFQERSLMIGATSVVQSKAAKEPGFISQHVPLSHFCKRFVIVNDGHVLRPDTQNSLYQDVA